MFALNFVVTLSSFLFLCFISSSYSIEIRPLRKDRDFAAEITHVSLEDIDDATFDLLHYALLKYKVVVVRNQPDFSVEGQRRFTKRFGHLHVHLESSSHLPGYQDVNVVSNIKNENGSYIGLFGKHVENFHSDLSWTQIPTKITVLKSVIRPNECGDTEYLDTHAAYDELRPEMKKRLAGLTANYCYLKMREIDTTGKTENLGEAEINKASKCAVHPILTRHPITGKRNVYANPSHTAKINNFSFQESEELLKEIFQHTNQGNFLYRHEYQDYDVILWDNRAVHHRATGCPDEFPRKLIRTTVSNDDEPREELDGDFSEPWDLLKDRVNAEYNPSTDEGVGSDIRHIHTLPTASSSGANSEL